MGPGAPSWLCNHMWRGLPWRLWCKGGAPGCPRSPTMCCHYLQPPPLVRSDPCRPWLAALEAALGLLRFRRAVSKAALARLSCRNRRRSRCHPSRRRRRRPPRLARCFPLLAAPALATVTFVSKLVQLYDLLLGRSLSDGAEQLSVDRGARQARLAAPWSYPKCELRGGSGVAGVSHFFTIGEVVGWLEQQQLQRWWCGSCLRGALVPPLSADDVRNLLTRLTRAVCRGAIQGGWGCAIEAVALARRIGRLRRMSRGLVLAYEALLCLEPMGPLRRREEMPMPPPKRAHTLSMWGPLRVPPRWAIRQASHVPSSFVASARAAADVTG